MAFMLACREISSRRTSVILVRGCEFVVLFLIPLSSALCQSQTINFAEYSGPSIFSAVDPPLQVGPATLSGGQILTDATNAPADEGTIYGTANFCSGCLPTITVDFSVPVSQLSMFLINGETFTVTYTVVDNQGGSQTITLVANFNSGAGTVALPESGITQVKVTGSAGTWDFAIGSVTFTPGATVLVDPVPNASCAGTCLLNGPAVTKDANLLATVGTIVQGIAADGVAQVLVRIPAQVGQQISLSLAPTSSNTVLGALADPLNAGSFEGVGPLTVTAVNTTAGPMAFALYQAPLDFSQGGPDNAASQRTVSLQIQVGSGPVNATTITILRPPVVLIHGLWDSSNEWTTFQNNFNTLATTQSFFVETVDYSQAVSGIKSTSPAYTTAQLGLVKASALGFGYNTPGVLNKINQIVNDFRSNQQCRSSPG